MFKGFGLDSLCFESQLYQTEVVLKSSEGKKTKFPIPQGICNPKDVLKNPQKLDKEWGLGCLTQQQPPGYRGSRKSPDEKWFGSWGALAMEAAEKMVCFNHFFLRNWAQFLSIKRLLMCDREEFGEKVVLLQWCSTGCNKHRDGHGPKPFLTYWCGKHGQEKKGKCGIWTSAARE